jgi:hypothetical protein
MVLYNYGGGGKKGKKGFKDLPRLPAVMLGESNYFFSLCVVQSNSPSANLFKIYGNQLQTNSDSVVHFPCSQS